MDGNLIYGDTITNTAQRTLPLISVRIPTWNRGPLLVERAINSVLYQTYRNLEIVVVGDNCTDRTKNIIREIPTYTSKIPIRFYNLPPRSDEELELLKNPKMRWFMGPVRATNEATKRCKGEWIAHIDDDDIWTPDHVEVLYNFAKHGKYDFVSSSLIRKSYGKYEIVKTQEGAGGCQTWLYRAELARQFDYNPNCWKNDINRVSDLDVLFRIRQSKANMGFLDKVTAYILPRPGEETVGLAAYEK